MAHTEIKELIAQLAEKVGKDEALQKKFKKDPIKTVEELTGLDLPDDLMEKVVDALKAKMTLDDLGDAAKFLKKLF